jgi:hypothetical protein
LRTFFYGTLWVTGTAQHLFSLNWQIRRKNQKKFSARITLHCLSLGYNQLESGISKLLGQQAQYVSCLAPDELAMREEKPEKFIRARDLVYVSTIEDVASWKWKMTSASRPRLGQVVRMKER